MTIAADLGPAIAGWAASSAPAFELGELLGPIQRVRETTAVVTDPATGRVGVSLDGSLTAAHEPGAWPVAAVLPPLYPEWLGDRSFNETHNTRFPYVTGAMANGIATTDLVIEAARAGCLGFFGAGGLGFEHVRKAVDELVRVLGDSTPWGCNLIHSPNEPALETGVANLYLERGVRRVHGDPGGRI